MNFEQLLVEPFWILPENEAYPNEDSGGFLCVFLHSHTEANYVEEHLLTIFVYFNISAFVHLSNENYSYIFRLNLTWEITSAWPFPNLKCKQIESLKNSVKRHIICDYDD